MKRRAEVDEHDELGLVFYEDPVEIVHGQAKSQPLRGTLDKLVELARRDPGRWAVAIYGKSGSGIAFYARKKYGYEGFEFTTREQGYKLYCRLNPDNVREEETSFDRERFKKRERLSLDDLERRPRRRKKRGRLMERLKLDD